MEKLKPVIGKSSISSLKFQKKSDFDKFLNFIKKQTKELEGIEKPKDETFGELSSNGAMVLSKQAGSMPRDLANKIINIIIKMKLLIVLK